MTKTSIIVLWSIISVFTIGLIGGLVFGIPALDRYQSRQDAQNQVAINTIVIQQQEQNIQVEKQKAQIRIVDAQGIAQAQTIIASSLSDSYLQYLAIQAQQTFAANTNNNTEVYIPTGTNGIPLIKSVDPSGK